jgi:PAS domain S-box-containing protein
MAAANEKDFNRLLKKDVLDWSPADVGLWLSNVGLEEYKVTMMTQAVGGMELVDLTMADLGSIGISKLGDKKKILREIRVLVEGKGSTVVPPLKPTADFETSSDSSMGKSGKSGKSAGSRRDGKIDVKITFRNDTERFLINQDISLSDLRRKAKKLFGKSISLSYNDPDGDSIRLRRDRDLRLAIQGAGSRLVLTGTSSTRAQTAAKNELEALTAISNPVIMIDSAGIITFFNPAAEEWFGYKRAVAIGCKVNILMPDEYADHHDDYIANYLRTGIKKVMGSGRRVKAVKRNGTICDVFLTLSESRTRSGRHFIGTLQDISSGQEYITEDQSSHFTILQSILDPAIVINQKGIVQFFNPAAATLFGYKPNQVVGRNVNMLMQGKEKREHDSYLTKYFATGRATVLGRGREVVAADSKGQLIPVHLSVTEQKLGTTTLFTGICRPLSNDSVSDTAGTGQRTILEQLREVLDDLLVASIITDDHGVVLYLNSAAEEIFGQPMVGIVNKKVNLLMPPDYAIQHDEYLRVWREGGEEHVFGVGRTLQAKHGVTGNIFDIRLSVSKRMGENGRYLCIGTVIPL